MSLQTDEATVTAVVTFAEIGLDLAQLSTAAGALSNELGESVNGALAEQVALGIERVAALVTGTATTATIGEAQSELSRLSTSAWTLSNELGDDTQGQLASWVTEGIKRVEKHLVALKETL